MKVPYAPGDFGLRFSVDAMDYFDQKAPGQRKFRFKVKIAR